LRQITRGMRQLTSAAGRGLPKPRGGAGDLYAVAQIVVPQQLSERERELYGELQAASNENPRRHMENA